MLVALLVLLGLGAGAALLVQARRRRRAWDADDRLGPEFFDPPPPAADQPSPAADPGAGADADAGGDAEGEAYDLQAAIDLSDVTVTDAQREAYAEVRAGASQIQSVDERFRAAKRKTEEYGMHHGIMPTKKRRELVEALVRRPFCGRRTRSWRTEFSDSLRGDVVPKNRDNTFGVMRIGRSDPTVDLHPGALGPMSGLSGRWVSTDNVPENVLDDDADATVA